MDINIPLDSNYKKWKNICVICHNRIDTNKEKYVNLRDFNGKKFTSECFYHLNCWMNRFAVTQETMNKLANNWLDKISNSMGGTKVYEIK